MTGAKLFFLDDPVYVGCRTGVLNLTRAMAYDDLSFMQSLALMLRQRHVVARIAFIETIEPAGLVRREVASIAQERIANRLGLPSPGNEPRTPFDLPAGSR